MVPSDSGFIGIGLAHVCILLCCVASLPQMPNDLFQCRPIK